MKLMIFYIEILHCAFELCPTLSLLPISPSPFCFLVSSLMYIFFLLPFPFSLYKSEEISPHSFFLSLLCLLCHFLPFPNPPFFFVPLNSPAVCVASGLVFCGSISGVCASFMLWMVQEVGFTAPAVMAQRFSLSRLAVKWSVGPLGEATPWTLLLKALSWPAATD